MKKLAITRYLVIFQFSILLFNVKTIHGREASFREENCFVRGFSWLKEKTHQLYKKAKIFRTDLPKGRLEYKAAQVNDTIAPHITEEQRTILLEALEQFQTLALNGAQGFEEPQELLMQLMTPQGRTRYAAEFALEEHKPFLSSEAGKTTLAQLLTNAPHKQNMMSYAQRQATQEKYSTDIVNVIQSYEQYLAQIIPLLKSQSHNPAIVQALEKLEHDPTLQEKNKRATELDQLLQEKLQDPELEKLLPLLQQKDEELQTKILKVAQAPGATEADIKQKAQEIMTEYEAFVAQYPPMQSYTTLVKERLELEQETQDYIQTLHTNTPELAEFIQLMQAQATAVDGYNECVEQLRGVPHLVAQLTNKRNKQIWCEHVRSWFTACIKALKENAHHDEHILHHEDEFKHQLSEFRQIARGWDDLKRYKFLKEHNEQHKETTAQYIEAEYKNLAQTKQDVIKETEKEIAKLLNIPEDTQAALSLLGIDDITTDELNTEHKSRIKKQYRKKSLQCHPDRHPNDPEANNKQAEISKAYEQLNNLLESNTNALTDEQKEQYRILQENIKHADTHLHNTKMQARQNLAALEDPLYEEEMLERDIENNELFQKRYPYALQKAQNLVKLKLFIAAHPKNQQDYLTFPERTVRDHT